MKTYTAVQAIELIDIAANEDRLWHYNGGQAYIRVSNDSSVLMVIDHTPQFPKIEMLDGTQYFKTYEGAQFAYSATIRDTPVMYWFKRFCSDVVQLDLV